MSGAVSAARPPARQRGALAPAAAWLPLAALSLLAAWPVLRAGYPMLGDGANHFYRLVQFDHLLRQGVWFPRWATDLGYGYGYPVFNYYPPLTYYLGAALRALGLGWAHSLLGVYALAFALAVTGAYSLARLRWGRAAGWAAAAAYGLAPYLYFDALARGALPETLALGLLPWAAWGFGRLAAQPSAARWVSAALPFALLWLTHILVAVMAVGVVAVVAWAVEVEKAGNQGEEGKKANEGTQGPQAQSARTRLAAKAFILHPSAFILSILLAAYFLLPAVLETRYVQVHQLTSPGDLNLSRNFLRVEDLLAWPRPYDPRLVFQAVPPSLSLVVVALAAVGVAAGWRRAARQREGWRGAAWEGGLAALLVGLAVLTLPASEPLWLALPLAEVVQFPWRLVGPASLAAALLAGAGVEALAGAAARRWPALPRVAPGALAAVVLGASWAYSLTWSFGPRSQAPGQVSVGQLAAYERDSGQLGTTSAGEFLPIGVQALPEPTALAERYLASDVIPRLGTLPEGVSVRTQTATVQSASAEITAQTGATLLFDFFYFPGWQATVDGQRVPVEAGGPHGLVAVAVPAGTHSVRVFFGPTPLRAAATVLSAASALSVAGLLLAVRPSLMPRAGVHARGVPAGEQVASGVALALAALVLLAARAALLDGRESWASRSRFDGAAVAGVALPLDVNFENQLMLMGVDGVPASLPADEALPLSLYWRAHSPPAADYAATVQVLDAAGFLFGQSDSQHPGRVPTTRWQPSQYAQDVHVLSLLPGTPPGRYRLVAGAYVVNGAPLSVLDATGVPQGIWADLGTLTVTRAARPNTAAVPEAAVLGPLALVEVAANTATPQTGDEVLLTLMWRAEGASRPDVEARLALVDAEGRAWPGGVWQPGGAGYPTSAWAEGEWVRMPARLRVPAEAAAGPAALQVSVAPAGQAGAPHTALSLLLTAPERTFDLPAPQHPLDEAWGGQVRLLGYDLAPGSVTLYWQAAALMDTAYTAFVHARGPDGAILSQNDAAPARGTRPTTGWLPGEVVADAHPLAWEGASSLLVGLYDPATGQRLGEAEIALP